MRLINQIVIIVFFFVAVPACTPLGVVNSIASLSLPDVKDIRIDELYWDPKFISEHDCPNISGTYLMPGNGSSGPVEFYSGVDFITWSGLHSVRYEDVILTINKVSDGLVVESKSKNIGFSRLRFNGYFGCFGGEYISRIHPRYLGGGESGQCVSVFYGESHWKRASNGDLIVNATYRDPCWIKRGRYDQKSETRAATQIFKRIK